MKQSWYIAKLPDGVLKLLEARPESLEIVDHVYGTYEDAVALLHRHNHAKKRMLWQFLFAAVFMIGFFVYKYLKSISN